MRAIYELFDDDDILAARMGRFSEADERMYEGLVNHSSNLWHSYGKGRGYIDLGCPGHWSTRPATPSGGQTFAFIHKTFAKRKEHLPNSKRGVRPNAGAKKQRYIERDEAVEKDEQGPVSLGTIAVDARERAAFWKSVSEHERQGGRIQSSIIAELPYEAEIGPSRRRFIVIAQKDRMITLSAKGCLLVASNAANGYSAAK